MHWLDDYSPTDRAVMIVLLVVAIAMLMTVFPHLGETLRWLFAF